MLGGHSTPQILAGAVFLNDLFVRMPDRPGFVFSNLTRRSVAAYRMRVGVSRFGRIAHESFLVGLADTSDRKRVEDPE
jgi:hypothetical protein